MPSYSGHNSPNMTPVELNAAELAAKFEDAFLAVRGRSTSNLSASPTDHSSNSSRTTTSLSLGLEDFQDVDLEELEKGVEEAESQWTCKFPGCDKRYKNAAGLKSHRSQEHPTAQLQNIPEGFLGRNGKRGKNVPDIYKPYKCPVVKCGKRYKNLNGLVRTKYCGTLISVI
jgi:hypothetical protein